MSEWATPGLVRRLLTMSPIAQKLLARRWFLRGFAASGRGFHGEIYNPKKHPALTSLLCAEFDRIWKQEIG